MPTGVYVRKLAFAPGMRFGRLTILTQGSRCNAGKVRWVCVCDCGKQTQPNTQGLRSGKAKSCGCWSHEKIQAINKANFNPAKRERGIWHHMVRRCYDPKFVHYKYYGGRGLEVCERWKNSFENFLADMGMSEGREIDHIDNEKGYSPENCKWVTRLENANNRRNNHFVEYLGERLTIAQWGRKTGLGGPTVSHRLCRGWSIERALTTELNASRSAPNRRG